MSRISRTRKNHSSVSRSRSRAIQAVGAVVDDRWDEFDDHITAPNPHGSMQWKGLWSGGTFNQFDVVRDGTWLMIANQTTTERPAPQPTGASTWTLPDTPTWATAAHLGVVYSGQKYTFSQAGWVTSVRVHAPTLSGDTHYRIVVADVTTPDFPVISVIDDPVLVQGAWSGVTLGEKLIPAGSIIYVYIDVLNSGSSTLVTGGWNYEGQQNTAAPLAQGWNRRTQQDTIRIDKTDLDSTDRTSELMSMIAGTTIEMVQTGVASNYWFYSVDTNPADLGSYVQFDVTLIDAGGNIATGVPTTMTATVPVAQSTDYVQIANHWPTNQPAWAAIEGYLELSGVEQTVPDNAFGVDIEFTPADVSTHWDIMAHSAL